MLIRGDERQPKHFCGSCKKVIGGITVGKVYRRDGERHFNREGRFVELQVLHGLGDPCCNVIRQPKTPFAQQDYQFTNANRRQP